MSNIPPSNYHWIGNTLSYTLDPNVIGLKLEYTKNGQTTTQIIFENKTSAPTSLPLSSSEGPKGVITGMTTTSEHEEWGPPSTVEITNGPVA